MNQGWKDLLCAVTCHNTHNGWYSLESGIVVPISSIVDISILYSKRVPSQWNLNKEWSTLDFTMQQPYWSNIGQPAASQLSNNNRVQTMKMTMTKEDSSIDGKVQQTWTGLNYIIWSLHDQQDTLMSHVATRLVVCTLQIIKCGFTKSESLKVTSWHSIGKIMLMII